MGSSRHHVQQDLLPEFTRLRTGKAAFVQKVEERKERNGIWQQSPC